MAITYGLKVNLSVAIVAMVNQVNTLVISKFSYFCGLIYKVCIDPLFKNGHNNSVIMVARLLI